MSEIATEINGTEETVSNVEFLGTTFADRNEALRKVEAYRQMAQRALLDTVTLHIGHEVVMTFRPSITTSRDYEAYFPCYSVFDETREPLTRTVTIRGVNESNLNIEVSKGELRDGRYDQEWKVRLGNILAMEPSQETA